MLAAAVTITQMAITLSRANKCTESHPEKSACLSIKQIQTESSGTGINIYETEIQSCLITLRTAKNNKKSIEKETAIKTTA